MAKLGLSRYGHYASNTVVFILFLITGLAISRLIYEAAFPRLLFLAHPFPVFLFALLTGAAGYLSWRWLNQQLKEGRDPLERKSLSVWTLLPLLINLTYLFEPAVDLVESRLLFSASIWLTALFIAQSLLAEQKWSRLGIVFILAALLPIYWVTLPHTVGTADTFEFQVVIPQMGIAHPTGYPLYLLLGRLFTFIPVGTVAWRINLASATFAILAAVLLFATARRLLKRSLPAVLAAVALGLTPVYWSQAIEAEVYALHALMVTAALWLMTLLLVRTAEAQDCAASLTNWPVRFGWQRALITLAFLIGLGLTNHLTTLFLLPPALLTIVFACGFCLRQQSIRANLFLLLKMLAAFLLPLLLYAYLPIRWFALHDEAMGLTRFIEWVVGGRFQGALQLAAWLAGMTRYQVVGRLMLQNWGSLNLILILLGLFYFIWLNWRVAMVLFVTWLGFTFYALIYFVPDLAVFIIPAHLIMALFWAAGLTAVLAASGWLLNRKGWTSIQLPLANIIILLLLLPSLIRLSESWSEMAKKDNDQLLAWAKGVLAMPLESGASILADSEKIAPLFYLQQAEGVRPDLEIMVLPDEAAYRSELDVRLNTGQTVYLARYIPGLESVYHLRSVGPLIEVSSLPILTAPDEISQLNLSFDPLKLVGIDFQARSSFDPAASAISLYWQAVSPPTEPHYVYMRWAGEDFVSQPFNGSGQHPAGNTYPTVAWQVGEIVPDFHLLPRPVIDQEQKIELQVAVGSSFQLPEELDWQGVTSVTMPPSDDFEADRSLRAQNGRVLLDGAQFAAEVRPQTPLSVILTGYGSQVSDLQLRLAPIGEEHASSASMSSPAAGNDQNQFTYATQVDTNLPEGRYHLLSQDPQSTAVCGWLAPRTNACILGEVRVSGVALPAGSTNYDDKIALLDVELPQQQLQPGGQLPINLRWQSLSPVDEDYTIFIQVLDAQDRIVGQVDAWPVQGTFPTSQWAQGEIIEDPYLVQLAGDMPSGQYQLHVGFYLLSTLQRLPLLDDDGYTFDDKAVINGLFVP